MCKKTVLVTGGDGFIGSHLVFKLCELGFVVIVVDNNVTSYQKNTDIENVIHIKSDIENVDINTIPKTDIIFHLASVASPLVYKNDFKNVYGPNVLGTEKVIEIAKRDKARLIYSSTSEVYGVLNEDLVGDGFGIKENTSASIHLLTSRSIYPNSKRMGEELVYNYKKNGGDAINLRLFNVYGNNMDIKHNGYGRVIPNFINAIKNNNPLQIFGDGQQVRSFIWINDLIEALIEIINYSGELPIVLNIGNDESISINNLANLLFTIFNKRVSIEYQRMDKDDPTWRKPNINQAKSILKWKPKVDLKTGLSILVRNLT